MIMLMIPPPLQPYVGGEKQLHLEGNSAREVIENLIKINPGIKSHILDPEGKYRAFLRFYIGNVNIQEFCGGMDAPLEDGSILRIVAAMAGG